MTETVSSTSKKAHHRKKKVMKEKGVEFGRPSIRENPIKFAPESLTANLGEQRRVEKAGKKRWKIWGVWGKRSSVVG